MLSMDKKIPDSATQPVDSFIIDYVNRHRCYFDRILGSRLIGKKEITAESIPILKEAYDKAHTIRSFEIELFWKRASFCFTCIAALFTILGILLTAYFKSGNTPDDKILWIASFITIFGVIFTITSNFIILSSDYWKNNWERHTVMLEPLFSGSLYATHLVTSEYRSSISKLTISFFISIYVLWLVVYIYISLLLSKYNSELIKTTVYAMLFVVVTIVIIIISITTSKNKNINVFITHYDVNISSKHSIIKTKNILIRCAVILIYGLLIFVSILIAMNYAITGTSGICKIISQITNLI